MAMIDELKNQPEISFIDNITLEDVRNKLFSDYAGEYERITGESGNLTASEPARFVLNAVALLGYQTLQFIDRAGKSNILGYSYGEYLDALAATRGILRKSPKYSSTVLRFTLSAPRSEVISIPGGTRAADANGHTFATSEYAEIPSGTQYIDISAQAVEPGEASNSLTAGSVNIIVDTLPYIASVSNISTTRGGADTESDESLTRRVFLFPGQYSTAGSQTAYEYHAVNFRSDIMDAKAYRSADGEVTIVFLLSDGSLPESADIEAMLEYISNSEIKPLTDTVKVIAPKEINYDISLKYFINKSDSANAVQIQADVAAAVEEYKVWQRHIARDINPSELIRRVINAGAKRVELTSPVFAAVDEKSTAKLSDSSVTYGGLEDD